MHHSLHVALQFTAMLDLTVKPCSQTSSAVQPCMSAAGIGNGCIYRIHCIVMLAVHTWKAQLVLFERVTGEGLLSQLLALVLLPCYAFMQGALAALCRACPMTIVM